MHKIVKYITVNGVHAHQTRLVEFTDASCAVPVDITLTQQLRDGEGKRWLTGMNSARKVNWEYLPCSQPISTHRDSHRSHKAAAVRTCGTAQGGPSGAHVKQNASARQAEFSHQLRMPTDPFPSGWPPPSPHKRPIAAVSGRVEKRSRSQAHEASLRYCARDPVASAAVGSYRTVRAVQSFECLSFPSSSRTRHFPKTSPIICWFHSCIAPLLVGPTPTSSRAQWSKHWPD